MSRYVGQDAAVVELADGRKGLVESMVPLRVKNRAGVVAPVDLKLERRGGHYRAVNP